ncbi:MAG TPA: heme-binding protein [Legionella sp.]|nr:heme-binding protein [Legionella sp.]
MAEAAEKAAIENKINIAIAILDSHGNLKYFRRMDNNNFVSVRMSQLKAMSSASIPVQRSPLQIEIKPWITFRILAFRASCCLKEVYLSSLRMDNILAQLE